MSIDWKVRVETKTEIAREVGFEALAAALAALERRRLIVVASCLGSGLVASVVFVALGVLGIMKPALLAYGIGALVLLMDAVAAAVLHVVQGRSIAALRAELTARFPGMPLGG